MLRWQAWQLGLIAVWGQELRFRDSRMAGKAVPQTQSGIQQEKNKAWPAAPLPAQVHVLHKYAEDFYGEHMRVIALGFIRRAAALLPAMPQRVERM